MTLEGVSADLGVAPAGVGLVGRLHPFAVQQQQGEIGLQPRDSHG